MSRHISLLLLLLMCGCFTSAQVLPTLNIDSETLTVSGFSSGGYFATQFHVAYSSLFSGCGIWSGGPELCEIDPSCTGAPDLIIVDLLVEETMKLEAMAAVDPTIAMLDDKIYLNQGLYDDNPIGSSIKITEFYDHFLSNSSAQVLLKSDLPSTHAVISDRYGAPCGSGESLVAVENCGYDSLYHMLNHLNGYNLTLPSTQADFDNLFYYDQGRDEFFEGNAYEANMGPQGLIFIPPNCASGAKMCRLHLHLHGCDVYLGNVGTEYVTTTGIMDTAEVNDMVILFPQITTTPFGSQRGCWNWYGYLGDFEDFNYAKKDAVQMKGVFDMVQRVAGLSV